MVNSGAAHIVDYFRCRHDGEVPIRGGNVRNRCSSGPDADMAERPCLARTQRQRAAVGGKSKGPARYRAGPRCKSDSSRVIGVSADRRRAALWTCTGRVALRGVLDDRALPPHARAAGGRADFAARLPANRRRSGRAVRVGREGRRRRNGDDAGERSERESDAEHVMAFRSRGCSDDARRFPVVGGLLAQSTRRRMQAQCRPSPTATDCE